eukprot:TRINITY_DN5617_c0_g1_i3.p1 TRINITY_DN5617_c0_g1~~TRINITY_DN5617_c0_g1_i3.p1  ORF type:complete len:215 (-),score=54.88 TRINITY_DN5617_c0_g1_i3:7-627(-)
MSAPQEDPTAVKFVENVQRRRWNRAEYEQRAFARDQGGDTGETYCEPIEARDPHQYREKHINLSSRVNKAEIITGDAAQGEKGGFYCEMCRCLLKDSATYLDHLNGRKHNLALGLTMQTERSTVEDVKEKLSLLAKRKQEGKPEKKLYVLEERIKQAAEVEERLKEEKKRRRLEAKRKKDQEKQAEFTDPTLASMGLPTGFGTSKK